MARIFTLTPVGAFLLFAALDVFCVGMGMGSLGFYSSPGRVSSAGWC